MIIAPLNIKAAVIIIGCTVVRNREKKTAFLHLQDLRDRVCSFALCRHTILEIRLWDVF